METCPIERFNALIPKINKVLAAQINYEGVKLIDDARRILIACKGQIDKPDFCDRLQILNKYLATYKKQINRDIGSYSSNVASLRFKN